VYWWVLAAASDFHAFHQMKGRVTAVGTYQDFPLASSTPAAVHQQVVSHSNHGKPIVKHRERVQLRSNLHARSLE
jgi:hypothetical protein